MVFNPEGNGALSESLVNYRVLRVGDIAFEGHKNKDFLFGRFVLNDVGNGIMSPRFSSLRPIEYLNISFWKQYIHYEPIMRGILKNSTKLGTMMNELVIDDFLKQPIDVPTLKEQTAIGDFFRQLDAAIASHQRKLERVKELKKSLLQKMFPKDGEAFPELRFPNFTDAWEQRKLGECVKFKITNSFSRENLNYENGKVRNIHYGDIHTKFQALFDIAKEKVPFINSAMNIDKISEDFYCKEGDLVFADASEDLKDVGKSIEIINLNNEKVLSGLHTLLARPSEKKFSKGFNGYLFQSSNVRLQIQKQAQGSKVLSINTGRLSSVVLSFPALEEQTAIGDFFRQLDAAIASHQRKPVLQKASKIKQADTISACFWLAKSSQMPHHNIGILIFKFLNNMNISVLRGGHARMPEPSRHAGNRYPGKKQ